MDDAKRPSNCLDQKHATNQIHEKTEKYLGYDKLRTYVQ